MTTSLEALIEHLDKKIAEMHVTKIMLESRVGRQQAEAIVYPTRRWPRPRPDVKWLERAIFDYVHEHQLHYGIGVARLAQHSSTTGPRRSRRWWRRRGQHMNTSRNYASPGCVALSVNTTARAALAPTATSM